MRVSRCSNAAADGAHRWMRCESGSFRISTKRWCSRGKKTDDKEQGYRPVRVTAGKRILEWKLSVSDEYYSPNADLPFVMKNHPLYTRRSLRSGSLISEFVCMVNLLF